MNDEIRLDRETFKALAADTRVNILKALSSRRMTGAELAQHVNLSPSTIKEHLDQLEKASLIEQHDEGRKWKYYSLTFKGRRVTTPERPSMRVWIVLGISFIALALSTANIFLLQENPASAQPPALQTFAASANSGNGVVGAAENQTMRTMAVPAPESLVNSCDAAPNSCLSKGATPEQGQLSAASKQQQNEQDAFHATASQFPTQKQIGLIDLALEATLAILVIGLGYYALKRKKMGAL